MKRLLLFALLFASVTASTQPGKKSPHDTVTYANGRVTYGDLLKTTGIFLGAWKNMVKYGV